MVMIGLEIHLQLLTRSKLFCKCSTNYQQEVNSNICEICTSQPGSKPLAPNKKAIHQLLKVALALGTEVLTGKKIPIQRKHYFYPDLPSNYQRTSKPIAVNGKLGNVRIREMHIEEDPGRFDIRTGNVEYNRSGVPLVEIVTEPDMNSPEQARAFLESLAMMLDYIEVTKREEGSMRIDANVSIEGGNRVEIKNINSFKGVFTALNYEIVRQKLMREKGLEVQQETRHYDDSQGITIGSRKKETVDDYRYIPDPDLAPIIITKQMVTEAKKEIPELPEAKASRLVKEYKIDEHDAKIIVADKKIAEIFEALAKRGIEPTLCARWLNRDLRKQLNYRKLGTNEAQLNITSLEHILKQLQTKKIHEGIAEQMLIDLLDKGTVKLLEKLSDKEKIASIVDEVLRHNQQAVADYERGEKKALNYIFGAIMKKTGKAADPKIVMDTLKERLNEKGAS